MSRKLGFCGLALIASAVAVSGVAEAQQGGPRGPGGFGGGLGGGFGGGKLFMLAGEQVQTELKITPEQKTKIEEISKGLRESMSGLISRDGTREERQKKFEETREQRTKLATEAEAKLDAILTADQQKRLDEISTQVSGVEGLRGEKLAAKLGLTAEQKTKITGILDEQGKKTRELFGQGREGGGRPDFSAVREKMTTIRKETTEHVNKILTSEQKTKWEEAKGKPFEFQFRGRGGNRPEPEKKPEAKASDL